MGEVCPCPKDTCILLLQARNHRVRLWHATRQIYDQLADSTQYTESVHLFPGEATVSVCPAALSCCCHMRGCMPCTACS